MKTETLLTGFLKVYGEHYFANVRHERDGKREWLVDIRRNSDGKFVRYAGLWNRKRDALEEAEFVLAYLDERYIPSPREASL